MRWTCARCSAPEPCRAACSRARPTRRKPTIDAASQSEDWRIAGLQLGFDPAVRRETLMRIGFERHSERAASFDPGTLATETLSTLRLGTDLQLSRTSRFEIRDAIDSGTLLSRRNDPQLALAIRPNSNLTLRVAAAAPTPRR
jgi:hypothetical protein